ncbi:MAG: SdrD B-like domain-containing protein, partial [Planctomycetota bacterium]
MRRSAIFSFALLLAVHSGCSNGGGNPEPEYITCTLDDDGLVSVSILVPLGYGGLLSKSVDDNLFPQTGWYYQDDTIFFPDLPAGEHSFHLHLRGLDTEIDENGERDPPLIDADCTVVIPSTLRQIPASVGDLVWKDLDCDGVKDDGEPGLAGIVLTIRPEDSDDVVAEAVTDADGLYRFTDVTAGSYCIEIDEDSIPSGLRFGADVDGRRGDGKACVFLAEGEDNPSIDFGLCCTGSLGDLVWLDENCNGLKEAGEKGLGGVAVTLEAETFTRVAVTDENGFYEFQALCEGSYLVTIDSETLPDRSVSTTDSVRSPASASLPNDETQDGSYDFGFTRLGS